MLETPHVLVAAAIASKIGSPIAIPIAFASHFLLDLTPHWNPSISKEIKHKGAITKKTTLVVAADSTIALILGIYIAYQYSTNISGFLIIIFSCLAAVLPDLYLAPYFFLNKRSKKILSWLKFKKSVQNNSPFVIGITTQLLVIAAVYFWLID